MAVTPIILEQRFPVGLDVSIPSIRQLYNESKDGAWNPRRDIDWSTFDAGQYSDDALAAARLSWEPSGLGLVHRAGGNTQRAGSVLPGARA